MKYRINTRSVEAELEVVDDVVTAAPWHFDWAIGRDWQWVRDLCDESGWKITPLLEASNHVVQIDHAGETYELRWNGNRCTRITRWSDDGSEDLEVSDLPEELQEMIE